MSNFKLCQHGHGQMCNGHLSNCCENITFCMTFRDSVYMYLILVTRERICDCFPGAILLYNYAHLARLPPVVQPPIGRWVCCGVLKD